MEGQRRTRCPACRGTGAVGPYEIEDGGIGAAFRDARKGRALTQMDVARALGLRHQAQVSALEKDVLIGPAQARGRLKYAGLLGVELTAEETALLEAAAQPPLRAVKGPPRRGRKPFSDEERQATREARREETRELWMGIARKRDWAMLTLRKLAGVMKRLDPEAPYVDAARLSRMERGLEGTPDALARIDKVLDALIAARGGEATVKAQWRHGWNRSTWRR